MVLDATDLDELQQDIADIYTDTMPDRCYIQRTLVGAKDIENPEVIVEEVDNRVYENIPCSYREARPSEGELVGRLQTSQLLAIKMAPIYLIEASDKGQILAKGIQPAINFEVAGVVKTSNATHMVLIAQVV